MQLSPTTTQTPLPVETRGLKPLTFTRFRIFLLNKCHSERISLNVDWATCSTQRVIRDFNLFTTNRIVWLSYQVFHTLAKELSDRLFSTGASIIPTTLCQLLTSRNDRTPTRFAFYSILIKSTGTITSILASLSVRGLLAAYKPLHQHLNLN